MSLTKRVHWDRTRGISHAVQFVRLMLTTRSTFGYWCEWKLASVAAAPGAINEGCKCVKSMLVVFPNDGRKRQGKKEREKHEVIPCTSVGDISPERSDIGN
jgi:hypothetical protein